VRSRFPHVPVHSTFSCLNHRFSRHNRGADRTRCKINPEVVGGNLQKTSANFVGMPLRHSCTMRQKRSRSKTSTANFCLVHANCERIFGNSCCRNTDARHSRFGGEVSVHFLPEAMVSSVPAISDCNYAANLGIYFACHLQNLLTEIDQRDASCSATCHLDGQGLPNTPAAPVITATWFLILFILCFF
jgi:hypothetical protein